MARYKRHAARERYAVLQGCLAQRRQGIWEIVIETRNGWHRYERSQIYDTVEHHRAFRNGVVFGLRRFAEEVEALLLAVAVELDRLPPGAPVDAGRLVIELSAPVASVRPRVLPPGLRHTLTRYLALRTGKPAEYADDELRVLAVGLWGLWERLETGVREFERWLEAVRKV